MMGVSHEIGAAMICVYLSPVVVNLSGATSDKDKMIATNLFAAGAMVGALLPDADTPQSTLGRILFPIAWPIYLIRWLIKTFYRSKYVDMILGHRGITHYPSFWMVLLIPLMIFSVPFTRMLCIGLFFGVLSHLILDYIAGGLRLLMPFSKKKYKTKWNIKTGGIAEAFISVIMLLIISLKFI